MSDSLKIQNGKWESMAGWLYLLPSITLNVLFLLLPVAATLLLAFTSWNGLETPSWVGFANFIEVFANHDFWGALFNNIRWMVLFLTLPIVLALIVAASMAQMKGFSFLQTIFLIPYILPTVVKARIWQGMIFNPETGIVGWLSRHGITLSDPLIHTETSLYGIAAVDMWAWWGFLTVIFFAAMRQVDKELIDASRVEGAGFWMRLLRIQIPLIKPTILFMMIMTVVWSFLTFDYIYVLTDGGPAGSSEVLSTLSYRYGFERFEFGKAAAVSGFAGLIGLLAICLYLWLQKRGYER
jgi:raffinose/stachyose/melibiose transport system permease protein